MIGSDYGTLGRMIAGSVHVKARMDQLTAQAASGHVADSYGGYTGAAAQTLFDLSPQVAHAAAVGGVIDAAEARGKVTQTAMTRLQSIAADFYAHAQNIATLGPAAVDTVAAEARQALTQVAGLLNTQDGSIYVFGGTDTATPPVTSGAAILGSPYFASIQAQVQGLAANGAAATLAATMSTSLPASAVSPFAADTQPFVTAPPTIQTANGATTTVGLLAGTNTLVPASAGPSTTGSYMRDLLRSLATLGSLTGAHAGDPGFAAVIDDTRVSLQGAVASMAADSGALGAQQAGLVAEKTQAADTSNALQAQVASVRDVDMAATLSSLQQVQSQLTASYKLIAEVKGLSLANYI